MPGNAGCWPQPMARRQQKKPAAGTTGPAGSSVRHSLRDGFNGSLRTLPGDGAFLPPSVGGSSSANLSASVGAPGPHDFAVRVVTLVARHHRVHRIPRSTFRDDWPNALRGGGIRRTIL